jgi:hypothetical protein
VTAVTVVTGGFSKKEEKKAASKAKEYKAIIGRRGAMAEVFKICRIVESEESEDPHR